jgi:hypothetical protein
VKSLTWRTQLWLTGAGYAAVFIVSAVLVLGRYLQEITHPADVVAYGGMFAFGDLLLGIFIVFLFMIPTAFLVWSMARFEGGYTRYAELLVGISLSAPVCLGLFVLEKSHMTESLLTLCLYRLAASPFFIVGLVVSRLVARFKLAKKLTSYALLIEGLTLAVAVAMLIRAR